MIERVLDRIASEGPMPFDEYMALCLYDESDGFFSSGAVRPGTAGDFITSPEVSPWFGRLVGRWAVSVAREDAVLVEIGGGSGALLAGLLDEARDSFSSVHAIEVSDEARSAIAESLPEVTVSTELGGFGEHPHVVMIANEVFDNMPARLVQRRDGTWYERAVVADDDRLAWSVVEAEDNLAAWCDQFLRDAEPEAVYAAQQVMTDWIADVLARGSVTLLAIDYAATTGELARRSPDQVVRTFRGHQEGNNPLANPGATDLTVEVNSDVLSAAVAACGGAMTESRQADFLRVLGADATLDELDQQAFDHARSGDVMAQLATKSEATNLRALLNEEGLGGFSVFEIQSGTDSEPEGVSEVSETMEDS